MSDYGWIDGRRDNDDRDRPMTAADLLVVHGRVDAEGRLIDADVRLTALQHAAGGTDGGQLAIPPIASIARLAKSLGIPVSRGVVAGAADRDIDLWVRAQPDGDGVRLAITGWQPRPITQWLDTPDREIGFAALEQDGEWACDAALRLTRFDHWDDWAGDRFLARLRLVEDGDGEIALIDALAARAPFTGQLVESRDGNGERLLIHGHPVTGPDGGFAGFVGGYRDLSGRVAIKAKHGDALLEPRPVETPLQEAGMADRLDAALRRPLHRIILNADAIAARQEGPVREDYVAYAGNISAASRHLLGVVDDLGDMHEIERAEFAVAPETIDLCDIARRAANLLSVRAIDRNVKIDAPPPDEAMPALGDFRRTLQILVNLLGNAVRYSPAGSSIWLRAEEEGDLAAVIVADQGPGIALGDQARIFDKFARLDPSEPGGSGLGLYISQRLARAMGGDITVDSAPGQGARFVLTLPR